MVCATALFVGCNVPKSQERPEFSVYETTDPRIESFLQEMVDDEHFSGVALVMQEGRVVHAKGYGAATEGHPNNVDTAFHVASITKQFTAAAILQLVERGELDLKSPINDHLPEDYRSSTWEAVTVHHLLSHSSGIPDYAGTRDYYEIVAGFATDRTVDGMITEAMVKPLEFPSGSRYAYSNLGYTLLGQIIEHVSGISYDEYLEANILAPMSMVSTSIHGVGHVPVTNEAAGFRWSVEQTAYVSDDTETLPATAPDAGLITTLTDFAKWAQIYTGEEQNVLTNESVAMMTSEQVEIGRGGSVDGYGYGLGVGDRLIAHSGHVVGFRSQFVFDRQTETLIAVFSNNSAINMERVAFGLLTVLFSPS